MNANEIGSSKVLIVDDEPMNVDMLSQRLIRRGYNVDSALSASAAFDRIKANRPDIILLDVFMPVTSGYDMLDKLRADPDTQAIPVILVSAHSDSDNIVEGLQKGANDYVTKPVNLQVLLARLETQLKMASLVKELEAQKAKLSKIASVDDLTGVYNRRVLFEQLDNEIHRCERYGHALTILMLDIDHFKRVNDEHGHSTGDELLRQFAALICNSLRNTDIVCRYGGEEFVAILPDTDLERGTRTAELIRTLVEKSPFVTDSGHLSVTVSSGVAEYVPGETTSATEIIDRADRALYDAKNSGRNRVCVFTHGSADCVQTRH